MKPYSWVACALILAASCAPSARADEYDVLRARWTDVLTGGTSYNPADPDIALALGDIEAAVATNGSTRDPVNGTGYWDTLNTAGGRTYLWSDLTSTTNSSQITTAYRRIYAMALAVVTHGSSLNGNTTLRADTISALDWMYANRYNETKAIYDNWWDWRMGAPLALNDCTALLYANLTSTQRTDYMNVVEHFAPDPTIANTGTATGANRMWKCKIVGLRGILVKDSAKIAAARDALSQLLDPVTTGDGFYADGSFIQHTKHPYTGGYGASLIVDLTDFLYLYEGSTWTVTDPDKANAFTWLTKAFEPLVYNGEMLDAVRGREISRLGTPSHFAGRKVIGAFLRATEFAPASSAAYFKQVVKAWLQADDTFGAAIYDGLSIHNLLVATVILEDAGITARPDLNGHYRFPSMDRVTHWKAGWGAALGLHSSRIYNYESINGENLKGWNTGAGMTYLYNADQLQFSDHFWPTVNAYRLPGTTVEAATTAPQGVVSGLSLVGGVESHGGASGLAAMNLSPSGRTLRGKKAWFFFDDEVVCLGAGILASGTPVVETIVENRRLNSGGTNAFSVNGSTSLTTLQTAPGTPVTLSGANYAHLAGNVTGSDIGYYFPGGATLKGLRETRSAAWNSINTATPDTVTRTNRYLTLWFDHGVAPSAASYAYALLPNYSATATATYAGAPEISVLENSTAAQAVKETVAGTIGAVFWNAATKTVGSGSDAITCNTSAAVMTQVFNNVLYVTVADPTQNLGTIEVELGRSATAIVGNDSAVSVVQTSPTIKLTVAVSGAKGAARRASFQLGTMNQVLVDNTDAGFSATGGWFTSTSAANYYGGNYAACSTGTGTETARWTPTIPTSGTWSVYYRLPNGSPSRATNAPFKVVFDGGEKVYAVNEQTSPGGNWIYLGSHKFAAGTGGYVEVGNNANSSYVIADAVKFVR